MTKKRRGRPRKNENKLTYERQKFEDMSLIGKAMRWGSAIENYREYDPIKALIFAIVGQSVLDARGGSVEALIWLLTFGVTILNEITQENYTKTVKDTCQEIWQDMLSDKIEIDYEITYLDKSKKFLHLRQDLEA